MTQKEKYIYIIHGFLYIIHYKEIKLHKDIELLVPKKVMGFDFENYPFIFDTHTKNYKKLQNNSKQYFSEITASVYIENNQFLNQEYRRLYKKCKDIISKKSGNFSKLLEKLNKPEVVRGQKLTSNNKVYVYIPEPYDFVYKGPFKLDEKRFKMLQFRHEAFMYMGSKIINSEIIIEDGFGWFKSEFVGVKENLKYTIIDNLRILDRESISTIQLSKVPILKRVEILKTFITTFLDAAILHTGDVGPWNTLVVDDECYLIDYEDSRMTHVFSKVSDIFTKKAMSRELEEIVNSKETIDYIIKHMENRLEKVNDLVKIGKKHNISTYFKYQWDPKVTIRELLSIFNDIQKSQ
jgi:hypothetical protein